MKFIRVKGRSGWGTARLLVLDEWSLPGWGGFRLAASRVGPASGLCRQVAALRLAERDQNPRRPTPLGHHLA